MARDPSDEQLAPLHHLVRRQRLALGLSQREAAHRAGLSLATWQSIERPTAATFKELTLTRVAASLGLANRLVFAAAGRTWIDPVPPIAAVPQVREPETADLVAEVVSALWQLAERSEEDLLLVSGLVRDLTSRLLA